MSTYSASPKAVALSQSAAEETALAKNSRSFPISVARNAPGMLASLAWAGFGFSCLLWQDLGDWSRTHEVAIAAFVIAGGILIAALLSRFSSGLRSRAPWLLALGLFLTIWEIATAKFAWLPLPFFPPPQAIIEVYTDDWPKLLASTLASVKLQLGGYVLGAAIGFLPAYLSGGRAPSAIGHILFCASLGHCRRRHGCQLPCSRFRRAGVRARS